MNLSCANEDNQTMLQEVCVQIWVQKSKRMSRQEKPTIKCFDIHVMSWLLHVQHKKVALLFTIGIHINNIMSHSPHCLLTPSKLYLLSLHALCPKFLMDGTHGILAAAPDKSLHSHSMAPHKFFMESDTLFQSG